ncbi:MULTISPECIES: hypothetical protein [unclassified Bradyrhizobium]|uniref:hypothetical protein n=1 Tax=unclassified Bradyrhizobium TaxID=2631580 RepID=UPI0028E902A9|nr:MULTISPECIES: hypothetical protein [unclassified Bradyrhizobium]
MPAQNATFWFQAWVFGGDERRNAQELIRTIDDVSRDIVCEHDAGFSEQLSTSGHVSSIHVHPMGQLEMNLPRGQLGLMTCQSASKIAP